MIFIAAANCTSSTKSIIIPTDGSNVSYTIKSVGGVVPNPLFTSGSVVICALDISARTVSFFGKAGDTGLLDSDLAKATATASDVMNGKTFYAGNSTLKTGTFSFKGTATAADVANGKTFYGTNSTLLTGNILIDTSISIDASNPGYGTTQKSYPLPYPKGILKLNISRRSEVGTGQWSYIKMAFVNGNQVYVGSGMEGEITISGSNLVVTNSGMKSQYYVYGTNISF